MMKCMNCGKEYEAKRATSKYCGAKCRKLAFQNGKVKVSVPSQGVTDEPTIEQSAEGVIVRTCQAEPGEVDIRFGKTNLPDCVPAPVRSRYAKGEPEYVKVIDRLVNHTLAELEQAGVWIPVWREFAGQAVA